MASIVAHDPADPDRQAWAVGTTDRYLPGDDERTLGVVIVGADGRACAIPRNQLAGVAAALAAFDASNSGATRAAAQAWAARDMGRTPPLPDLTRFTAGPEAVRRLTLASTRQAATEPPPEASPPARD